MAFRTVALRFFNVYGERQALSNPYTGVLAIFAARLLNRKRPLIFEDGRQRRDFVHVGDIAEACRLASRSRVRAAGRSISAAAKSYTVLDIADRLARALTVEIAPEITHQCRIGDIRHSAFPISARPRQCSLSAPIARMKGRGTRGLARGPDCGGLRDAARAELTGRGLAL